jgi:hypothetical protein
MLAIGAMAAIALPQSLPPARAIVKAITQYVGDYQRQFVQLVADERAVQRVTAAGSLLATRELRGELFSTFLADTGGWMSLHDIQQVDGEPVPAGPNVRALLQSQSIRELGPRLAAENARYNLGHVSRNFNEPTLALLLFTPLHVGDVSTKGVQPIASPIGEPLAILRVVLDRQAPLVRGLGRHVTTTGEFEIEPTTGRVRRTMIVFDDGDVTARLETRYAADDHVGMWVPVAFTEHYTARHTTEVTDVTTTLDHYRRFETSGRVVP